MVADDALARLGNDIADAEAPPGTDSAAEAERGHQARVASKIGAAS